jgi:hypothetical protein
MIIALNCEWAITFRLLLQKSLNWDRDATVQKKMMGLSYHHMKNTKSTIDRRYLKYCPETTLSIYGGGR